MYQFTVSEGAAVGTPVGRVTVEDLDMGENTDVSFLIKEGGDLFKVSADVESQRAVVSIKKVQLTEFCVALQHLVMVLIFTLVKKSPKFTYKNEILPTQVIIIIISIIIILLLPDLSFRMKISIPDPPPLFFLTVYTGVLRLSVFVCSVYFCIFFSFRAVADKG